MKRTNETEGRTSLHGDGQGVPSLEDVEQRAREIVKIEGRDSGEITDADRERARLELRGADTPPTTEEEAEGNRIASRDPADPVGRTGRKHPKVEAADESALTEEEALEGAEEAAHDRMLAERQNREEAKQDLSE